MPAILAIRLASAAFLGALAVMTTGAPEARAADLMKTCAPEIARMCSDVRDGRGRVTACLASRSGELGPSCRAVVRSVSQKPLTPAWVRAALSAGSPVALPAACTAPAATLCPGMSANGAPVFACLYARSDRVPAACMRAAEATLERAG